MVLLGEAQRLEEIEIPFPNGQRHALPVVSMARRDSGAEAAVLKDAGDDPDITHGSLVLARVEWTHGDELVFAAGEGVGTVTKKGLAVLPGEPAINPGPRRMIREALAEITDRAVRVTISIPRGRELARKTYNPRLGVVDGLSILGTSGRVRPFSCDALRCSVACELGVAKAAGVTAPVLVPGHIGERSAHRHFSLTEDQVIEVGNLWGFALERLAGFSWRRVLLWGHPGKLAKLAARQWNTHSSHSISALEVIQGMGVSAEAMHPDGPTTTEGLFAALDLNERTRLAQTLCAVIAHAAGDKIGGGIVVSAGLVSMQGEVLGTHGDLSPWQ
jgi:cobalt-precorrin-5B (C1)-methyltransferase